MTIMILTKENIQLELAYCFRCLVHHHHGGRHGMQADMVMEKELESSTSGLQAVGRETVGLA